MKEIASDLVHPRHKAAGVRIELMAPAGGPEAGYAALAYGADAIYLGLPQFSARAEAVNFSLDDMDAITAYAHSLAPRRRVFAALNTLVLQRELAVVIEALGALSEIGVDALIVQDLGVYRLAKRHFPEFRLHASTQMAVHNRAGVEMLRELGFARATLARELTLDEVRDCSAVSGIETEVFIHGTLCYAYSGLCLMSSHALGRSGNRGRCAYLCRDRFAAAGEKQGSFLFNMKDLALPDAIAALRDAGVASCKIEGRMKGPLYVAATVNLYRRLLDGTLDAAGRAECEADIQSIFSRPWTELHAEGRRAADVVDTETVGHRGTPAGRVERVSRDPKSGRAWLRFTASRPIERHDGLQIDLPGQDRPFGFPVDELRVKGRSVFEAPAGVIEVGLPADSPPIPADATVYCSSSQAVKRKYRFEIPRPGAFRARQPAEIAILLTRDQATARARLSSGLEVEESMPGPFEAAKDPAKTEAAARQAFEKLGDTRFTLASLEFGNPEGLFVPVSQWNALRRHVTEALEARFSANRAERLQLIRQSIEVNVLEKNNMDAGWSIKVEDPASLAALDENDWRSVEEVVVPAMSAFEELAGRIGRDRVRVGLPLIVRSWEAAELRKRVEALRAAGWEKWEAPGLASWGGGLPRPPDLSTDWSVYVMNASAAAQVLDMGAGRFLLSPEDGLENMRTLLARFGARAGVLVFQDTPLYIAENCIQVARDGRCPGPAACEFRQIELRSSHDDRLLAVNRKCRMIVVNRSPFCLADRLPELEAAGARHFRADFSWRPYSPEEVRELWRQVRAGRAPRGSHRGNFERGLL